MYEAVGAIVMFRGCAVTSLVVGIVYFSIQQYIGCKDSKQSEDKKEEELKEIGEFSSFSIEILRIKSMKLVIPSRFIS